MELGPLAGFDDLAKLHEGIALQVHYYNTKRIHTALRMSPAAYAARLETQEKHETTRPESLERVLQKVGG